MSRNKTVIFLHFDVTNKGQAEIENCSHSNKEMVGKKVILLKKYSLKSAFFNSLKKKLTDLVTYG